MEIEKSSFQNLKINIQEIIEKAKILQILYEKELKINQILKRKNNQLIYEKELETQKIKTIEPTIKSEENKMISKFDQLNKNYKEEMEIEQKNVEQKYQQIKQINSKILTQNLEFIEEKMKRNHFQKKTKEMNEILQNQNILIEGNNKKVEILMDLLNEIVLRSSNLIEEEKKLNSIWNFLQIHVIKNEELIHNFSNQIRNNSKKENELILEKEKIEYEIKKIEIENNQLLNEMRMFEKENEYDKEVLKEKKEIEKLENLIKNTKN
ncbi:hypothetical protein M0811_00897 [Anaeramoeba ignava]|uniref:Uncharacterized protein n=1 Tax=Anaeramoeba ignava TaxID=1746090 RepID=A0A9Q0LK54_ANAIG|nr:hypothetical protein M0811_00897 [Anaeramoeba ignava]